jgi:MFS family permease
VSGRVSLQQPYHGEVLRFLVVLAAGFASAASIGKLVPHVAWMAQAFDVSLAAAGFAVSSVMLPGALLGPLLGFAADRLGARRVALFGLALQACASFAAGSAGAFALLVAARLVEGLGYSLAIVAATVLVAQASPGGRQALALAVWSSFAPIGFALGQLFAGAADSANPLPVIGAVHALVLGIVALSLAVAVPDVRRTTAQRASFLSALRFAPALGSALAFGCATGVLLGAVAVAPLALAQTHGLAVAAVAQLTAAAALPGIAGRFASGWFLGAAARPLTVFVLASVAGSAALVAGLMWPVPLAAALACFAAFQICIGVLPGVMSAMLPRVAPSPEQLGTVSGLATQMVTTGNLLAPPLVLGVYAALGVGAATGLLVGAVLASVALVAALPVYRQPIIRP